MWYAAIWDGFLEHLQEETERKLEEIKEKKNEQEEEK